MRVEVGDAVQNYNLMASLQQQIDVDYYAILGVPRNASPRQICQHYRQLALENHPALNHPNPNAAYRLFAQSAEAFDVLHDPKKAIYDLHGESVLKEGLLQHGDLVGKYKFTTDPEEIFEKFFGTKNVFEHLLDAGQGGESHPIFKAQYPSGNDSHRVDNLVVNVPCTLTELYNGCTKQLTYDKKVLTSDGKAAELVKQTKTITINPGDSAREPIVFVGQGHQEPGYKQSMLIFKIVQQNEKGFRRDGDNLIYTAHLFLMDALDSQSIEVVDLGGNVVSLHFDEIISPQTCRLVAGRGMPKKACPEEKGDLIVRFDISFPQELPLEKKRRVVELLRG